MIYIDTFKDYYKKSLLKLNEKIQNFNNKIKEEENDLIKENIDLFANLNSDGKLIRGTLVNLGYKLLKEDLDYSYVLALAFEVFQTSILVHDDIIDNDILRRGKETIHAFNQKKYYDLTNNKNDAKKISESIAICMGDLGLYYANQIIATNYKNDPNLGNILIYFNDIVLKTIKGELIDVILPFIEKNNLENINLEENIMLIYKLKTAYYTIIGPLCLGMILANSKKEYIEDMTKFGYNLGIAFQIQDDILGIYGDDLVIGKNVGSDIEEFKQTILYSYVKENKEYFDELNKIYGKKADKENISKIRKIFDKSGAKEYALDKINFLYNEALDILDNIKWIDEENKAILKGLVLYLKSRKK